VRDLKKEADTAHAGWRILRKINVSVRSSVNRWLIRILKDTAIVCSTIKKRTIAERKVL
jgi:hypothetical protein